MRCERCKDIGWVCEAHPNKPWAGPKACHCGAAGMPCPSCNPVNDEEQEPDFVGVMKSVVVVHGKTVH
ncbi:hypothetical protein FDR95_28960 [Rhizobiaceae bacterium LC148]|nr:hypothetical protein FDR95_28960 [Rhizobiaceae bacterium LC148]